MSTDLAKLKDQLNRIMNQADKFERNSINVINFNANLNGSSNSINSLNSPNNFTP